MTELTTAMGHSQGANRHEEGQFPQRLDDYSTDDNPVLCIDAFVDELDLEARGFRHAVAAATGRPSYHPGDLRTLYIDGDLYRLRSSRRLEQETPRNVELMWLLKKLRPAHQTIANVRRDHLKPRREVCRAFTLLCKQLELVGGEVVAIDGSQFRSEPSTRRGVTSPKPHSSR
jgi:transposase